MVNAFTTDLDLSKAFKGGANKVVIAAKSENEILFYDKFKNDTEFYQLYDGEKLYHNKICLSSLQLPDKKINALIEYVLKNKADFMAVVCRDLKQIGETEARFHLSPIMLLHKLGLLENARIVGGVYLDNDDVDLMIQQNASLILTPSYDSGNGNGIANAASYVKRGLSINLGTGDNRFNKTADIFFELNLLELFSNGTMCSKNSIDPQILNSLKNG